MTCDDCKCAIDLLSDDYACQRMSEREMSEREQQRRAFARGLRPAIGRTNNKDDLLGGSVAMAADPMSECFGSHLFAAAVEKNGENWSAPLLPANPLEQSFFCAECMTLRASESCAAIKVHRDELLERVAGCGLRSNMRKNNLHGSDDTTRAYARDGRDLPASR